MDVWLTVKGTGEDGRSPPDASHAGLAEARDTQVGGRRRSGDRAAGSLWAASAAPAAIDASALDTAITAGPAEGAVIEDERPTFSFAATLAGGAVPRRHLPLLGRQRPRRTLREPLPDSRRWKRAPHSFAVFAEDAADLVADPTPARRTFSVLSAEEECEVLEDEEGLEEEDANCRRRRSRRTGRVPPEECLLRTARARLFTYSSQNKIRLVDPLHGLRPGRRATSTTG